MSETLVERVARAIWQESVGRADWPDWDRFALGAWGRVRSMAQARAAIAALREPTEGMMHGFRSASKEEWAAAIDAALAETGGFRVADYLTDENKTDLTPYA